MKVLAVIQLICATIQLAWWIHYRRAVRRAQRSAQRQPGPFRLDGCNCPPTEDGSYRAWHFGGCPWDMK